MVTSGMGDEGDAWETVIARLKARLSLEPDDAEARCALASVYLLVGQFDEGVAEYEHAAKIAPRDVWVLLELGKAYTMLGDYGRAIPAFERVLNMDPNNTDAARYVEFLR